MDEYLRGRRRDDQVSEGIAVSPTGRMDNVGEEALAQISQIQFQEQLNSDFDHKLGIKLSEEFHFEDFALISN